MLKPKYYAGQAVVVDLYDLHFMGKITSARIDNEVDSSWVYQLDGHNGDVLEDQITHAVNVLEWERTDGKVETVTVNLEFSPPPHEPLNLSMEK